MFREMITIFELSCPVISVDFVSLLHQITSYL